MRKLKTLLMLLFTLGLAALLSTAALADDATSGTCGENVTWSLEGGVLTISGEGEMEEISPNTGIAWDSQRASITKIIIEDGVTTISSNAFNNCINLTSVTIPDSVTFIDEYAFWNCKSLTSIAIPDSVTSIGYCAFHHTAYYKDSDNWENSVLYIGHWLVAAESDIAGNCAVKSGTIGFSAGAFDLCSSLTSVTIPNSVTFISELAFSGCSSLTSVTIPDI